jgi:hypothetical protein
MSSNIEVCYIRLIETRQENVGIFLISKNINRYRVYVAEIVHPSGKKVIAQTGEFPSPYSAIAITNVKKFTELQQIEIDVRNRLVQHLFNDGWEMMTTNEYGEITSLKRQIGTAQTVNATSPADLLKQLASLRDGGVLTEEEFQSKKAELLKRI